VNDALATRIGVTRIANVTGLDRVGFPVASAIRPQSRNLSVSMGKGRTLADAMTSAVMEAAELTYSERPPVKLLEGRFQDFSALSAIDPRELNQVNNFDDLRSTSLSWIGGQTLYTGESILVPWQAISMDMSEEAFEKPRFIQASGTGLAAAFHHTNAKLHGLCEVVERDSHNKWNTLEDTPRMKTLTDPRAAKDDDVQSLLALVERAGLELFLWNATGSGFVPCYIAELVDYLPTADVPFAQGSAAHPVTSTAIKKAIAEALQVRLTYIAGHRDDLEWNDYGERYRAVVESRRWLSGLQIERAFPDPDRPEFADAEFALESICNSHWQQGKREAISVSLSSADDDIAVVKIIMPGAMDIPDANAFENQRRKHQVN
jgi:YcaO-like protein with predicted kinase domain